MVYELDIELENDQDGGVQQQGIVEEEQKLVQGEGLDNGEPCIEEEKQVPDLDESTGQQKKNQSSVSLKESDLEGILGFNRCSDDAVSFLRKHNILEDLALAKKKFHAKEMATQMISASEVANYQFPVLLKNAATNKSTKIVNGFTPREDTDEGRKYLPAVFGTINTKNVAS